MSNWKLLSGVAAASIMTAAIVAPAEAQVTTSSIRGNVTTDAGAVVPNAAVTITHTPSGTVSLATTNASGAFSARGLRVGGPYTVAISGGVSRFAAIKRIQLRRTGADGVQRVTILNYKALADGAVTTDIELKDGDVIEVDLRAQSVTLPSGEKTPGAFSPVQMEIYERGGLLNR